MFGKKNYTIQPTSVGEDVLIQISTPAEITKKTKVTVPTQQLIGLFFIAKQNATLIAKPRICTPFKNRGKMPKRRFIGVLYVASGDRHFA